MHSIEKDRSVRTDEQWFSDLRARFVEVARRRVRPDLVEDLVQDAIRVIHEKWGTTLAANRAHEPEPQGPGLRPDLGWCFQVLRNTIGTSYQRDRTRRARDEALPFDDALRVRSGGATPLEELLREDSADRVRRALRALDSSDPKCARYLRRLAEGVPPVELARAEHAEPDVLYRRVFRCRQKLRRILREHGVDA